MSNNLFRKFSLKSIRSESNLQTNQKKKRLKSKSMEQTNLPGKRKSSLLNIKPTTAANNHIGVKQSQEDLDLMHQIVDQTDNDLRHALEQAAIRREQLDDLHFRSEEMLSKNENLVFGITNYRKTQERDLFWRRFRYTALGAITIGIIILLIALSIASKRSDSSPQVIDIRHSNQDFSNKNNNKDITSTLMLSTVRRRKRKLSREVLSSKSKQVFVLNNNL